MTRAERDALIRDYDYLAVLTAGRVRTVPVGLERDDLIQCGRLALIKAARTFDPRREVKFLTYAIGLIRGAILECMRQNDWVPRSVRERQKQGESVPVLMLISSDVPVAAADKEVTIEDLLTAPDDTEREVLLRRRDVALLKAVRLLPEREQIVVCRYYGYGETFREIAEILGVSESRAYQLHVQALANLRRHVDPGYADV